MNGYLAYFSFVW